MFAYVGARTSRERNGRADGISVYRVDPADASLTLVQVFKDLVNPSFLAISRDGSRLYTVHADQYEVSAFAVDADSGTLTFLNQQSTAGKNPAHLAIDPSNRFLVVTNHFGSSVAVLPIEADGSLGALAQLMPFEGPLGPHRIEQTFAKPHANTFDPAGAFVIVPDKGLDRVYSFRFDQGRLIAADPPFVTTRETAGPRHVAFHPSAQWAYVVNELDSTVTAYRYGAATGALTPFQVLSALPDSYTGTSRAAEIEVDRHGRFVYASNRGSDSIAIFKIDPASGRLAFIDAQPSQGALPRFFTASPDGHFMYVLNEGGHSIVVFRIDPENGRLTPTGFSIESPSPVCMVFSPAKP